MNVPSGAVDLSQFTSYAEMVKATGEVAHAATSPLQDFSKRLQEIGNSLMNLARAGLAGTAEGNRLSFAWMMLSRQIASVFLPAIQMLTNGLFTLTSWFKNLSGEGQSITMMIAGISVALRVVGPLFGILKGLFSPVAIAIGLLLEGLMQFLEGTAEGQVIMAVLTSVFEVFTAVFGSLGDVFKAVVDGVVVAFQLVVRGFMWLGLKIVEVIESIISWIPGLDDWAQSLKAFREKGQAQFDAMIEKPVGADAKVNKDKKSNQVNPSGFGFESLSSSWERVMGAANKQDSIPSKQLKVQEKQLNWLEEIAESIKEKQWQETGTGGGDF